jgi:hypothetical protein
MLASAAPNVHIDLALGVDNLVAILALHAEDGLNPKIDKAVDAIHRLGGEIGVMKGELLRLFDATPVDPAIAAKCEALVAAAEALGIRLTYEVTKGSFNPDTLKYTVGVKVRIAQDAPQLEHAVEGDHATGLRDAIAVLTKRMALVSHTANEFKKFLNPSRLDRHLRAKIGRHMMNQTASGAATVDALCGDLDQAIGGLPDFDAETLLALGGPEDADEE